MKRGPKRIEIPGKKWKEKFIHEKKTWHVVHKQDGITYAVCELRPGVVGGLVERFYIQAMAKPKDYIGPLVIVWKTSNRSNAQTKIKKTPNYSLDYFLQTEATIPGIPKDAVILELGIGKKLFDNWKEKYKIVD